MLDPADVPAAFDAVTEIVYSVPLVSEEIVHVVAVAPAVQLYELSCASTAVAVNPVTAVPEFDPGVHVTAIDWLPAIALSRVGAPGTTLGVRKSADVGELSPMALVATTVTEYSVPLVSPVIVHVSDDVVQYSEFEEPSTAVAV